MDYSIIELNLNDPRWRRFVEVVASLGETETTRINLDVEHFISSHILVAMVDNEPIGYLRYVVQRLGEDEERPLVKFKDTVLLEAKVIAFAVVPAYQNQGIGRALQHEGIKRAKEQGCYQFRSRSHYDCQANHHLKISMGFGIQPSLQNDSLYFVMPLHAGCDPVDAVAAD